MDIAELLERYRSQYVTHFLEARERAAREHGRRSGSEFLFEAERYAPDRLYKLLRADYAWQEGEGWQLTEIALDRFLDLPTMEFQRGECKVVVEPFHWNRCNLIVDCERVDREALVTWATHWIDMDEERPRDENNLKQAIHYMTPPGYPLGKMGLGVDLGTAPVRALLELIRLISAEKGTETIRIH
ncbi:MAG: hypothetical protein U0176_04850 [Bacteroidia bacterium]